MDGQTSGSIRSIGIAGLGLMGSGMAGRLIDAGFEVAVFNRTAARAEPLRARGARVCANPRELAASCEAVITMLSDAPAVEATLLGPQGAIGATRSGTLFIDSSTVTPATSKALAAAAAEVGCGFLDAPVLGSKNEAANGQLDFLVGGEWSDFDRAAPLFEAMGKSHRLFGPTGSGSTVKLVNNMICAVFVEAMAEGALALKGAGIDADLATQAMADGALGARLFRTKFPKMLGDDFSTQFALELMQKDVRYYLELAQQYAAPSPAAGLVAQLFAAARRAGWGKLDMSAVHGFLAAEEPATSEATAPTR